jgi:hypothetical protein
VRQENKRQSDMKAQNTKLKKENKRLKAALESKT